jgi:hypothetical protein
VRSLLFLVALAGCADPRVLTIGVTTGHESDAFTLEPAIGRVDVEAVGADGAILAGASAAPGGSFTIGELSVDTLIRIEVKGYDGDGAMAMRGRSLSVLLAGLQGEVWPVFAQRVERWSRPPGGLTAAHVGGAGTALGERFLVIAGGDGDNRRVDFYDMLSLQGLDGGEIADLSPRSVVPSADGRAALFIGNDRARWLDFDDGNRNDQPELPTGLASWAEVAGGLWVPGDGAGYLVGGARSDTASDRVLVIEVNRSLRAGKLVAARKGAAAGFVEGKGLVVAGGSGEAPGVEIMAYDAEALVLEAKALDFAPDATEGAALAVGTGKPRLVCGDGPSMRLVDLDCEEACEPEPRAIDFGVILTECRAFALADGWFVVGAGPDGLLTSLRIDDDAVTVMPLREPRRGAAIVPAPNGTLAIFGGADASGAPVSSVETWFPSPP